jgi:hypothetical protein
VGKQERRGADVNWYDRYVYWRLGPAARLVYAALDNPDAWEVGMHTMIHKPSKLQFWVANGAQHFRLYKPDEMQCFNGFERKVLWARIEHMKRMYLFTKMASLS